METSMDGLEDLEHLTLAQDQPISASKKPGFFRLTRRKVLFIGLALLIVVASLVTIWLQPRAHVKWSYQLDKLSYTDFAPIVNHDTVYTLVGDFSVSHFTVHALDKASGHEKWSYSTGFVAEPPILANGIMYLLSDDLIDKNSTLHALDTSSGHELWFYKGKIATMPAVVNGVVYLVSESSIYALDGRSGNKLWVTSMGSDDIISPFFPLTIANDMVYTTFVDSKAHLETLYALDASSGIKKWFYQEAHGKGITSQPVVNNDLIYLVTSDFLVPYKGSSVDAFDAISGQLKWSYPIEKKSFFATVMVANNMVYAAVNFANLANGVLYTNVGSALYVLSITDGQKMWSMQMVSMPVIAHGIAYIRADGKVYALDALSGHKKWSYAAGFINPLPEQGVVDGMLYVNSYDGGHWVLHALDAASGSERWSYQADSSFDSALTVEKGVVYVYISKKLEAILPPGVAA